MRQVAYYFKTLTRNLFSIKGLAAVLSSFGSLWLIVEVTSYFFPNAGLADTIRGLWWAFFAVGMFVAVKMCWPVLSVSAKLRNRDIQIQIVIGDIFDHQGAIVIGTNSTFDTRISKKLISDKSIQGQFTKKYYGEGEQLDAAISPELADVHFEVLSGSRIGKYNKYPNGTVVRLNPKDRTAYLLVIADINEHGTASGTFEGLRQALAQLWTFVATRGLKEPISIPVLGSGFLRLVESRKDIIHEIIKSFIAASSQGTFCERLSIYISSKDALEHDIDLKELGDYLHHQCKYTEFASGGTQTGSPVP